VDILATQTYVSDKGCRAFSKLNIVKAVMFGATLSKTHRKTRCLFVGVHPFHSERYLHLFKVTTSHLNHELVLVKIAPLQSKIYVILRVCSGSSHNQRTYKRLVL